ncbi:MAG: RNA methyltransferase [Pseudomonadota bacterium]|nr:RNA methyltransferase [Pseudomonadota bacterium]
MTVKFPNTRTPMAPAPPMRGFFAIGAEGISKAFNLGNMLRSAHAFGASFVFTIGAEPSLYEIRSTDTSDAPGHLPLYHHNTIDDLSLPVGCALVGVELLDDAVELPRFRHPLRAAYILGPENGSLSPEVQARCDHTIIIPTRFCLNVGIAGALVMYDRLLALGPYRETARTLP